MATFDFLGASALFVGDTSATTVPIAATAVNSGELIVVAIKCNTPFTMTIGDGGVGMTWSTPVYAQTGGSTEQQCTGIAWAIANTTGNLSVTAALNGSRNFRTGLLTRYELGAGLAVSQVDSDVGASGDSNVSSWSTAALTVAVSDLVVCSVGSNTSTARRSSSNMTSAITDSANRHSVFYAKVASGTTFTPTGSITSAADTYAAIAISLRAVGSDTTPPTGSSSSIGTNGTTLTINFSEAVSVGSGGNSGFTLTASGGATTLTYSSGSGSSSLVYTSSRTILQGETITLSYTQPGNGIEDAAGNDLATFSGAAVTNSSTQVGGVTHPSGWPTVTVGATLSASQDRVKGDPDISTGNIIAWGNIQGTGTVTVFNDGSYEYSSGVTSFQFQIYDGTWGNVGTITIGVTGGATTVSGRARRYVSNTLQAIRTFARKI